MRVGRVCYQASKSCLNRNIKVPPPPKIPKYPVPALHSTLEKYLKSVRPLLSNEEYNCSEHIVNKFGEPGGVGEELQCRLLERAEEEESWLAEWWLNAAYLEFRKPVVVYSSPGLIFPQVTFSCSRDSLVYAAKIIAGALDYKKLIDDHKLPQDKMGNDPLDMSQYGKVFGTCRLPQQNKDTLNYHPDSKHIVVAYKNNFYKLDVNVDNKWLKFDEIFDILVKLTNTDDDECKIGPGVGILTSNDRDAWGHAYEHLCCDSRNIKALKAIEESLFLMCLDSVTPEICRNEKTTTGLQCVHGGGPTCNGTNRWFDKTIQFIVGVDGGNGLTYEHSPAEGQPVAVLMDYIIDYIKNPPNGGRKCGLPKPHLLEIHVDEETEEAINLAKRNLQKLVNDVEFNCFEFSSYGKDCIKTFRLSPDSYLQMAMQYAFYRVHGVPGAHYESASTRKFMHGRTETIRSCSVESLRFIKAMCDETLSDQSKANALRVAVDAHKDYTIQAINARGVDRHLFGLKTIAANLHKPEPDIFKDVAYIRSTQFRISTSQVASKNDSLMVYGPSVEDGYAICYNPRDNNILFGTSKFTSSSKTDLDALQSNLEIALEEMKDVLKKAPKAKL